MIGSQVRALVRRVETFDSLFTFAAPEWGLARTRSCLCERSLLGRRRRLRVCLRIKKFRSRRGRRPVRQPGGGSSDPGKKADCRLNRTRERRLWRDALSSPSIVELVHRHFKAARAFTALTDVARVPRAARSDEKSGRNVGSRQVRSSLGYFNMLNSARQRGKP
jgi:hypothetical protein